MYTLSLHFKEQHKTYGEKEKQKKQGKILR